MTSRQIPSQNLDEGTPQEKAPCSSKASKKNRGSRDLLTSVWSLCGVQQSDSTYTLGDSMCCPYLVAKAAFGAMPQWYCASDL